MEVVAAASVVGLETGTGMVVRVVRVRMTSVIIFEEERIVESGVADGEGIIEATDVIVLPVAILIVRKSKPLSYKSFNS